MCSYHRACLGSGIETQSLECDKSFASTEAVWLGRQDAGAVVDGGNFTWGGPVSWVVVE